MNTTEIKDSKSFPLNKNDKNSKTPKINKINNKNIIYTKKNKEDKRKKKIILQNFLKKNKNLAKQGTEEWLAQRKGIIGGSEISCITGDSGFLNLAGLVARKVGLSNFQGNLATRWGKLFEPITQDILSILIHNKKIYETGSVPHEVIKGHRFSPDGLTIMPIFQNGKYIINIILLEIKSPFSSIPNSKIPPYYLPQIKAGTSTIQISDSAVFINNMFRKCSIDDLNVTMNYDTNFHSNKGMANLNYPVSYGVILFSIKRDKIETMKKLYKNYIEEYYDFSDCCENDDNLTNQPWINIINSEINSDYESEDDIEFEEPEKIDFDDDDIYIRINNRIKHIEENKKIIDLIDLGKINKEDLNDFLILCFQHDIFEIKYIKPSILKSIIKNAEIINGKNTSTELSISKELKFIKEIDNPFIKKYRYKRIINKYIDKCDKNKSHIPIAVLPWKLFKSNIIYVEKDENYLNKYEQKINEITEIINTILSKKNIDEIKKDFIKFFPNSDMIKLYDFHNKTLNPNIFKSMLDLNDYD